MKRDVQRLLAFYPRIYFACHTRHVRDDASGNVLTSHQGSILDHLDERQGLTVTALSDHMGVTPGTMSIHIDRLENMGFVLRRRGQKDGRQVEVLLTLDGVRVRDTKSVLDPHLVARMLDQLTPKQRRDALNGLALLAEAATASMTAAKNRKPA